MELMVWQKASELLKETVHDISSFPSKIGVRQIGDQLFRSVSSISANIAEGFGKRSRKEFIQACVIARGEIDESRNWYYQCKNLSFLGEEIVKKRDGELIILRKMLTSLISHLNKRVQ